MKKILYAIIGLLIGISIHYDATASSHREAPLISNDPLADNTDLYVFRSPCDTNKIVIIANYVPFEHPRAAQTGTRSDQMSVMRYT